VSLLGAEVNPGCFERNSLPEKSVCDMEVTHHRRVQKEEANAV